MKRKLRGEKGVNGKDRKKLNRAKKYYQAQNEHDEMKLMCMNESSKISRGWVKKNV